MSEVDKEIETILKTDEEYHSFVQQHDRYSITVNAGFPSKGEDPAQVIDDAIGRGLAILTGRHLRYMRLVSVTTTILNVSYGEMVLATVIVECLPPKGSKRRQ